MACSEIRDFSLRSTWISPVEDITTNHGFRLGSNIEMSFPCALKHKYYNFVIDLVSDKKGFFRRVFECETYATEHDYPFDCISNKTFYIPSSAVLKDVSAKYSITLSRKISGDPENLEKISESNTFRVIKDSLSGKGALTGEYVPDSEFLEYGDKNKKMNIAIYQQDGEEGLHHEEVWENDACCAGCC